MSLKTKNIIQFIALSVCCITAQTESSCTEKAETGYELEQKSHIFGNTKVRVSPSAIQVTDLGKNIIYTSRAPSWILQIVNPAAGTYYECKLLDFGGGSMNRGVALFTGGMLTDVPFDTKPTKESDGLLRFTSSAEYTKHQIALKKNVKSSNGLPKVVDAWVSPLVTVPPQAITLISRLYGISETKGMPVRVRFFDFSNDQKVFLSTTSLVKKPFTDNDFAKRLPTYQRVPNVSSVYRSKEQDDAVGDMLQGMDTPLFRNQH